MQSRYSMLGNFSREKNCLRECATGNRFELLNKNNNCKHCKNKICMNGPKCEELNHLSKLVMANVIFVKT